MAKYIMTKYEYTRIRGIRLQQLIDGIPPFINVEPHESYESIFNRELVEGKLPLIITRPNGFNSFIDISVSEMDISKFV
tara:strand:- start:15539 stop:15775 length:237 start_codon:yes stop_codon:yes gene_type:complete